MFMFPANQDARLPDVFVRFAAVPDRPAVGDYGEIEQNREAWIEAWTETVLR
jgi:thiamine transport system substrate-binding protein